MSTTTLSTLNSENSETTEKIFEGLYATMTQLKEDTVKIRDNLKSVKRRIQTADLSERLLDPKPHTNSYFLKYKIPNPCSVEEFMNILFSNIAKEKRLCHRTRTLYLTEEEAVLFHLKPRTAYKWLEVLQTIPNVFY